MFLIRLFTLPSPKPSGAPANILFPLAKFNSDAEYAARRSVPIRRITASSHDISISFSDRKMHTTPAD